MKSWLKLFLVGFVSIFLFIQSDGSIWQTIAIVLVGFVLERILHFALGLNKDE